MIGIVVMVIIGLISFTVINIITVAIIQNTILKTMEKYFNILKLDFKLLFISNNKPISKPPYIVA